MLQALAPAKGESFLEIGPGRGALTRPLAKLAGHALAIEIDRDLAAALREERLEFLSVLQADFLSVSTRDLQAAFDNAGLAPPVRVVGNLPYNVAAPILFRLRDHHMAGLGIGDVTVMVQREVAERLVAPPGSRAYGALPVLLGYRADIRRLFDLPPGAFRPAPSVRSSLVRLTFHAPAAAPDDEALFEALVKALFSRRRKTLANGLKGAGASALQAGALVERLALERSRRPETLSIPELVGLSNAWRALVGPSLSPPAGGVL